jgi:hypothetical protein
MSLKSIIYRNEVYLVLKETLLVLGVLCYSWQLRE